MSHLNFRKTNRISAWFICLLSKAKYIKNVESVLRIRENNAYDSFTKGENEYLQVLLEQAKKREGSHIDVWRI
jgi:hypothetical protein